MNPTHSETLRLIEDAVGGDREALCLLLEQYRDRLRRMVALRLDPRLQGRVDASDVIQEGYLDAARRLEEFGRDRSVPFYVWLRFLVGQRLSKEHRRHLGVQVRDAGREVAPYHGPIPEASTAMLAAQLLGKLTSPSEAVMRVERKLRFQEALNAMDAIDREVLILRHYEQLSNGETAKVLGLDKSATSKRHARALGRLKEILSSLPGGPSEDGT